MTTYIVSWSMPIEATTPRDAAKQAAAWLEDGIKNSGGANVLVVRDLDDKHVATFDEFGFGKRISRKAGY